ncbi:MATE family efflux transporter [Nonomuraea sp. M3C6]|uniref:Probable multidrug resistance protein NorM n=1 Tax=Nonomuraea marmarensis TaxID=3351344 RepID=A0ABW7AH87_9ACTN
MSLTHHRTLLTAAIPIFLSSVAYQLSGLVGTALLGHQATTALAAYAVSVAVLNPAFAAVSGALRGMAPFIAPHREHPAEAIPILRDARWLTLAIGSLAAGVVMCIPLIASLGGAPRDVLDELGLFPILLVAYVLLYALGGGANAVLIALGHSRQVLWGSVSSTIISITLVIALVPRLGLAGMGIAMVAAGATALTISNLRVRQLVGGRVGRGRPRIKEIMKLARVGIPLSGTILIKFAVLGVVTYAAVRTGTRAAAAHAILFSMLGPLMFVSLAVAQASVPEVARADGGRAARQVSRAALTVAVAGVAIGALTIFVSRDWVVSLYTQDAGVGDAVLGLVPLLIVMAVVDGTQLIMGFGLAGLKRSTWSLGSVALAYGVLALVAVPIAQAWGLSGLWGALIVNSTALILLQTIGFYRHSAPPKPPLTQGLHLTRGQHDGHTTPVPRFRPPRP